MPSRRLQDCRIPPLNPPDPTSSTKKKKMNTLLTSTPSKRRYEECTKDTNTPPTCALCQGEHTANHLQCPMNPLNRPKKDDKKKKATEERQKLKAILKGKSTARTGTSAAQPNSHTTPTTYAEAAKGPSAPTPQPQSPGSISDAFNQLRDPECVKMFRIIKNYITISKSTKSTADKFNEIMTLLEIDNMLNIQ
ncbi:hypothetical protein NPIL_312751 [Nephila pilipes]|uniref:Uncharacterized protein n=1 Tax=Nephila pilipes TaxID=299642 RepID=A0A8X6MYR3_NEPPI|nr:hypothetical protein NPIL_312751 [Nephila pilipes]